MPEALRRYLRYTSWPIIAAMIALIVFGVMAIRVSERSDPFIRGFAFKQALFAGVAMAAFIAATVIPYQRIGRLAYPLFGLTLGLLVLVLFLPPIRKAHRWIDLKLVLVQPSEIAKLSYIVLLAWYLRNRDNYRRLVGLIVPFVLTVVPVALILREPDLGTSLLLFPTLLFMLFMAGAKLRHLLGIVAIAALLVFLPVPQKLPPGMSAEERASRRMLAYWAGEDRVVIAAPLANMKRHQIERIEGWIRQGDEEVRHEKGYQLYRSRMILGAGCVTGRGDWNTADDYFRVLPDDHTDFIFSVIGGQWGLLGCLALLVCYGVIFLFGFEIATITYDAFGRLLAAGVLALLLSQIFINVGMTMGLMPITGMTLPLVSYGGTSLVVNGAALGLLVNVGQRRPILLSKRPFEYGEKKEKPPAPFGPLAEDQSPGRRTPRSAHDRVVARPEERQNGVHHR
ncbi:MAG TPA: FtsW/RodA/SpoVE family cell cycle protein [Phycisphaerae bacterium]|nr:FtsW/RodA/SpoVE family cell cycle protein [Phycisphaerae bacterium]